MRNIIVQDTSVITIILGVVFIVLLLSGMLPKPQMWVYPFVRQAVQLKVDYETSDMIVHETEHFKIKYTQVDADTVALIAEASEAAYSPVTRELGYAPPGKTLILVQPNRNELRKAFGWSGSESAMGVYWGGVIQLLSPHVWLNDGESVEEFIHSGPMVHEYTHLVFDHLTNGNYPRWFTEGLAQYVEYRVNNYEWHTESNRLDGKLYTMAELEKNFDELPNQSLAYRQSLAAVRFIGEVYGEEALRNVIASLQAGNSMKQAIQKNVGLTAAAFEQGWQKWAMKNMNNQQEKH